MSRLTFKSSSIIFLWLAIGLGFIIYLSNFLQVRSDITFFLPEAQDTIDSVMKHQLTQGEAGKILLISLSLKEPSAFNVKESSTIFEKEPSAFNVKESSTGFEKEPSALNVKESSTGFKKEPSALNVNESSTGFKKEPSTVQGNDPAKHLANINKKLTALLKNNKQFVSIHNGNISFNDLLIEPYYQYRYLLQSNSEADFSNSGLTNTFDQLLQKLQFMPGSVEQKLFSEDPQMLWFNLLKQWQTQKLQKHHGVWFDQHKKQSLLFIKTRSEAYDLIQQKKNTEIITAHLEQLISTDNNLTYILTGAPVFALESKKAIRTQIQFISVIASVTLMAFLFWFFRSIKILILIGLPLGFAILTGMSTVILFDGFIHGITIAFGITIIGIAVDYPVHLYSHILLSQSSAENASSANIKQSQAAIMQSVWPLLRLGLVTTLIGFSAITLSDFSGLRQLGLFAMSGLLAAAGVTRFLLPQISIYENTLSDNADKDISASKNLSSFKILLFLIKAPLPKWTVSLSIILPFIALIYIGTQQSHLWQNDLSAMSPIPAKQKQLDFELRRSMGLPELRYALILQSSSIEDILQQSELLKAPLNKLKRQGFISAYDMANHYLPSIKFQTMQQEKLPEESELKQRLEKVLKSSPLSAAAFSPFIASVTQSKQMQMLSIQSLLNKPHKSDFISDKIKILLYAEGKQWIAIIPLQGVKKGIPIQSLNQQVDFSVRLLDLKTQTETILSNYRNNTLLWFLFGSLLIFAVLFFQIPLQPLSQNNSAKNPLYKRVSKFFLVAWPFTGAVILTFATLLLMGYSLSVFHLVTLLLVIGLGIDYSIFMLIPVQGSNKKTNFPEVAHVSVIICLISTLIMFGALSLSDLPVLKAIGLTASLGALYSFLLARTFIDNATAQTLNKF